MLNLKKLVTRIFLLAPILALGIVLAPFTASAKTTSLFECYQSLGRPFPSLQERAIDAAKNGVWQYKGTAEQNQELSSYLCPGNAGDLGFSVVTDYQKTLSSQMTATQDFVSVSSLTLRDGTSITMADLGVRVFLTVEPGATKEEIVVCTGVDATLIRFTGCTRGLAFKGTDLSAVTANQKTHAAGSTVVISNVHYVYDQFLDRTGRNQDIAGIKTFSSFPKFATTSTLPTQGNEFATKAYVDNVGAGGFTSANVSTTRGLSVDGSSPERVGINASSSRALAFDSDGKLYVNASTTQGLTFGSGGDLQFDGSRNLTLSGNVLLSGNVTSTGVFSIPYSSASSSPVSYGLLQDKLFGNGSDGAFSLSSGNYQVLNTAGKYVYQYSSFSLTGNSKLVTGSNLDGHPLQILVQGDLTITSASTTAISRVGAGSAGAAGGAGGSGSTNAGAAGVEADFSGTAMRATAATGGTGGTYSGSFARSGGGGGGGAGFGNAGVTGGTGAYVATGGTGGGKEAYVASAPIARFLSLCHMGGGGGGGGGGSANGSVGGDGGAGSRGGGCLQFIVGGNINVTSTISVAGSPGSNGVSASGNGAGGGGGGGGGGGSFGIFYNGSVIANTGTYTVTGGVGGTRGASAGTADGGSSQGGNGGAGGDGQSVVRRISSVLGL